MLYRCTHCNSVYDPAGVETIARYADCDIFKAPCCGRTVDNREWKSMPDIERVQPGEIRQEIHGNGWRRRDVDGQFVKVVRTKAVRWRDMNPYPEHPEKGYSR